MAADTKVQMAFEYRSKKSYNPKFTAPPPTSVQTSESAPPSVYVKKRKRRKQSRNN